VKRRSVSFVCVEMVKIIGVKCCREINKVTLEKKAADLLRPRQTKRILRPLVLEILFRASTFRTRVARETERQRRVARF